MSEIGRILKEARQAKKFTQEDLAHIIGKSKNVISNWERGDNKPDIETLAELIIILDLNPLSMFQTDPTSLNTNNLLTLSPKEKELIFAYRKNIDAQKYVDKLLNIKPDNISLKKA
jgi:transcriptional regulator with XRE-family HTH domain